MICTLSCVDAQGTLHPFSICAAEQGLFQLDKLYFFSHFKAREQSIC